MNVTTTDIVTLRVIKYTPTKFCKLIATTYSEVVYTCIHVDDLVVKNNNLLSGFRIVSFPFEDVGKLLGRILAGRQPLIGSRESTVYEEC